MTYKLLFLRFALIQLLLIPCFVQAQKGFHIGPLGGLNSTYIINQQTWSKEKLYYQPTLATTYGFLVGFNWDENFGVQSEFRIGELGQKYRKKSGEIVKKREINIRQWQIPLLIRYTVGGKYKKYYIMFGPQFGLKQTAEETGSLNYLYSTPNVVTHKFNRRDTQLTFEIGTDRYITKGIFINAGFRFASSVYDINQYDWKIKNNDGVYRPSLNAFSGLTLGVQYLFPIL